MRCRQLTLVRTNEYGFAAATIVGFLLPFAFVLLIATAFHIHTTLSRHGHQLTSATAANAQSASAVPASTLAPPTASDIAAANAAISAYCSNDLRADSSCALVADSDVTAPGFVESGISESGQYETGADTTQGLALAKGSGGNWAVIWVGQGCVPNNVATQNQVPTTFTICAS